MGRTCPLLNVILKIMKVDNYLNSIEFYYVFVTCLLTVSQNVVYFKIRCYIWIQSWKYIVSGMLCLISTNRIKKLIRSFFMQGLTFCSCFSVVDCRHLPDFVPCIRLFCWWCLFCEKFYITMLSVVMLLLH